ncbi:hypothetical protein QE152_g1807 [Popillia japonica]|uniref:Secreted protein n=1 Tax=Popillia japonica TaxID=7064 RepID=A0AAW1N150_POPJA
MRQYFLYYSVLFPSVYISFWTDHAPTRGGAVLTKFSGRNVLFTYPVYSSFPFPTTTASGGWGLPAPIHLVVHWNGHPKKPGTTGSHGPVTLDEEQAKKRKLCADHPPRQIGSRPKTSHQVSSCSRRSCAPTPCGKY